VACAESHELGCDLNREFIRSGLHEISIETKKSLDLNAISQRATERLVDSMELVIMRYCGAKWATYMLSLRSLCEAGAGTPYPNGVDID